MSEKAESKTPTNGYAVGVVIGCILAVASALSLWWSITNQQGAAKTSFTGVRSQPSHRSVPESSIAGVRGQLQEMQQYIHQGQRLLAAIPSFDRSACEVMKIDVKELPDDQRRDVQEQQWSHGSCRWCVAERNQALPWEWREQLYDALDKLSQLEGLIRKVDQQLKQVESSVTDFETRYTQPQDTAYLQVALLRKELLGMRAELANVCRQYEEQRSKVSALVLEPEK